jgi:hypothetical protein
MKHRLLKSLLGSQTACLGAYETQALKEAAGDLNRRLAYCLICIGMQ